jgi:predicted nucleic acid-binding Zn finger protein
MSSPVIPICLMNMPDSSTTTSSLRPALTPLSASIRMAMLAGLIFSAQTSLARDVPSDEPSSQQRFEPMMGTLAEGLSGLSADQRSRAISADWTALGELVVTSDKNGSPADGVSVIRFKVQAMNKAGQVITGAEVAGLVTIEVDGARVRLPKRLTSEIGPDAGDTDRVTPGIQVRIENGVVEFEVLAPSEPRDVKVRISAGDHHAEGVLSFVPELREMLAVGIVEARLAVSAKQISAIQPVRSNDAFELELKGLSRSFSDDKAQFGARAAVFLKGKVKGDYLLTLALDSDKPVRDKIFRDIDPNAFYPVYGDSSQRGFDARSATRLFVRVDKNRSYLLFGDHNTASVAAVRKLGQYSRALNGLRLHHESGKFLGNVYISSDSSKQVIDEFPARGVSGPYALSNGGGLAFSERVELVVRDRSQPAVILRTTVLTRFADYEFEPFSGKILFKTPVPSMDEALNPVSIRVTYEVDQTGPRFWFYGADGQYKVTERIEVGGSFVRDKNPFVPFALDSVNASAKLGERV